MSFIYVINAVFSASLLQSSVSHDRQKSSYFVGLLLNYYWCSIILYYIILVSYLNLFLLEM